MEREKFDKIDKKKNIISSMSKENKYKMILLIGLKNILTNSCMKIEDSVFYYKFKKWDDNGNILHLSGVVGGMYECLPPEKQYRVLSDKIKDIIFEAYELDSDDKINSMLNAYKIPRDYALRIFNWEKIKNSDGITKGK